MRRSAPMGRAARRRIRDGGPLAKGRRSLSLEAYRVLSRMVAAREGWRCGFCGKRGAVEIDHAVPRSQGGGDSWANCHAVCRTCHRWKDAAYTSTTGRLCVWPIGDGTFFGTVARHASEAPEIIRTADGRLLVRLGGSLLDIPVEDPEHRWGRVPTARERAILEEMNAL